MSILGVKKKHVDTSEIEKNNNVLTLRILNIENMITTIKSKPDRKIISIYAGIDGPIENGQRFNFSKGGEEYIMNFPGQIISISLATTRTMSVGVYLNVTVNDYPVPNYGISAVTGDNSHGYVNFDTPFKVKAGDRIGFASRSHNPYSINTLVSVIIELFI